MLPSAPMYTAGSSSLDAAGVSDPVLRSDLLTCRALLVGRGRSYSMATALLPPAKRPWVWALYGFGRYADEFVDSAEPDPIELLRWSEAVLKALAGQGEDDGGPVGRAMAATIARWAVDPATVETFLGAMRADITVHRYETFSDLQVYMNGSAAAIGLQMLPILQVLPGANQDAITYATLLAHAFQMTNFIRDVGEDLDLGRIYLPTEDLDAFGLSDADLYEAQLESRTPRPLVRLLQYEIERTRQMYRDAVPGIGLLHPTSRDAVWCATRLYARNLDAVEKAGYQVLDREVSPSRLSRASITAVHMFRASRARADQRRWHGLDMNERGR